MRKMVLASRDTSKMNAGNFYLLETVKGETVYTNIGPEVSAVLIKPIGVVATIPFTRPLPISGRQETNVFGHKLEIQYSSIHPVEEMVEFRVSGDSNTRLMEQFRPHSRLELRSIEFTFRHWTYRRLTVNGLIWELNRVVTAPIQHIFA